MLVYELNAGQMVDDVRLAVNGAVPVHSIGGVSQDESGMRQGELLGVDTMREDSRGNRRSRSMTEGTPVDLTGARKVAPFAPDLLQTTDHYLCSGCGHPVAWRLLVEVLDELNLVDRSIGVVGHGCYTQIITTADVEFLQCLHGRAPAVATGMKRMLPDRAIYTLQGDGDMVSEGLAEVLHIAARGESITCILLDNGVFGDTGGQMTATTSVGQRTKTDVSGRVPAQYGYPIPIADLVAQLPGVAYVARVRSTVRMPCRAPAVICVRRSSHSSRVRASRSSRSSRCARPAGRFPPTKVPSTSATRGSPPPRWASSAHADVDARIHDVLTRAARIAPGQCGATLGDEQRTFGELDAGSSQAAHRLAAEGVAAMGSGGVVGSNRSRRARGLLRRHEAGGRARADQSGIHRNRSDHRDRVPPAARHRGPSKL